MVCDVAAMSRTGPIDRESATGPCGQAPPARRTRCDVLGSSGLAPFAAGVHVKEAGRAYGAVVSSRRAGRCRCRE